jgi:hypothetical protein
MALNPVGVRTEGDVYSNSQTPTAKKTTRPRLAELLHGLPPGVRARRAFRGSIARPVHALLYASPGESPHPDSRGSFLGADSSQGRIYLTLRSLTHLVHLLSLAGLPAHHPQPLTRLPGGFPKGGVRASLNERPTPLPASRSLVSSPA